MPDLSEEARKILAQHDAQYGNADLKAQADKILAQEKMPNHEDNWFEKYLSESAQDIKSAPHNANLAARGFAGGSLSTLWGVNQYKNKLLQAMGLSNKAPEESAQYQDLINKVLPQEMEQEPVAKYSKMAGEIAPTLAIPAGPELEAGEGALAFLPKIPSLLKHLGYNFGVGEAISPVFNPDASLEEAYKKGAVPSAAGALVGPALAMGKNALGGLLRQGGTASAENFERNIQAADELGIDLPIGQAAASPNVSSLQSATLSNIPFSGMPQHFMDVGHKLEEGSNDVVNSLKTLPEKDEKGKNPLKQLMESAKNNYLNARQKSTANYKARNNYANSIGKKVSDRSNIKKAADDVLATFERRKSEHKNTPIDAQLYKDLQDAAEANPMEFEGVNPLRSRYREAASEARASGKNSTASIYEKLLASHNADIEKNLERINDPKLRELNDTANKHYAEWLAPVKENKTLNKYLNGRGKSDLLVESFSKKGWDQPETQAQIMKYLSPKEQRQYAGEYLSKFEHQGYNKSKDLNEDRMLTNYKNLGDQTKEIMFKHAPEEKQKLDAMVHVRDLYDSDIKQLLNPKNGEKGAKQWLYTLGLLSNIPTLGGVGLASHAATHYLTSPLAKSAYRKGLQLKGKSTKTPVNNAALMNALLNREDTE